MKEEDLPLYVGPLEIHRGDRLAIVKITANGVWPTVEAEQRAAMDFARKVAAPHLKAQLGAHCRSQVHGKIDVLVIDLGIPSETAHVLAGALVEGLKGFSGPAWTLITGHESRRPDDQESWVVVEAEYYGNPFKIVRQFDSLNAISELLATWVKVEPTKSDQTPTSAPDASGKTKVVKKKGRRPTGSAKS